MQFKYVLSLSLLMALGCTNASLPMAAFSQQNLLNESNGSPTVVTPVTPPGTPAVPTPTPKATPTPSPVRQPTPTPTPVPTPTPPPVTSGAPAGSQLKIFSGEGQAINSVIIYGAPLVAQLTDASGNPLAVAGVAVNWSISLNPVNVLALKGVTEGGTLTTVTDSTGKATATVGINYYPPGSSTVLSGLVTAALVGTNQSVIFHETAYGDYGSGMKTTLQITPESNGNIESAVDVASTVLRVNIASELGPLTSYANTKISMQVYSESSYSAISCREDQGAQGLVYTDSTGWATCTLLFGATGTGTLGIRIGGTSGSAILYGPFVFTVSP